MKVHWRDFVGKRVGDLLVHGRVAADRTGSVMACTCACGAAVELSVYRLNRAGREAACEDCRRAWRRHLRRDRAAAMRELYLKVWKLTGSLYWFNIDDLDTPGCTEPVEGYASKSTNRPGQPAAYMIGIRASGPEHGGWLCAHCNQWFGAGRGCLLCTDPVCPKCFGVEAHRCQSDADGMTLQDIGELYGIGREAVRAIESRALRKLRHPSRAQLLEEFARAS